MSANVVQLLQRVAADRGDSPAVLGHDGRRLWTFGDLAAAASRLASGLAAHGIGPGDRVLALVPNSADFLAVATGILWAGAAVVIPPRTDGLRQMLSAASSAQPRAIIVSPLVAALAALEPGLRHAPLRFTMGRWRLFGAESVRNLLGSAPIAPVTTAPTDPAVVSYTTGTTGPPKLIVRTHGLLQAQHAALRRLRPPRDGDVDLAGLPLLVLHNVAAGVPSVLPLRGQTSAPAYGARLGETLRRSSATTAAGFPALFETIARHAAPGELRGLRAIHIGGAQVLPELLGLLATAAPAAEIVVVYGSTEAEPIATIEAGAYLSLQGRSAAGEGTCVGRPVHGIELRIEPLPGPDLAGQVTAGRASRAVGRVLVAGAHVATSPTSSADTGWLDTGDAGWLDPDGRLWLLGRCTNVAAGRVFPGEVEPMVEALPWVWAAALVNVVAGSCARPVLAVEPLAGGSRTDRTRWRGEVEALAAQRGWPLAGVAIVNRLPRDARSGSKIDYPRLGRLVADVVQRSTQEVSTSV